MVSESNGDSVNGVSDTYCLTPKGLGIVDERRAETAVRVRRISTENQAILLVPQTAAATGRVLWALVCLFFRLRCFFLVTLSCSVYKQ